MFKTIISKMILCKISVLITHPKSKSVRVISRIIVEYCTRIFFINLKEKYQYIRSVEQVIKKDKLGIVLPCTRIFMELLNDKTHMS